MAAHVIGDSLPADVHVDVVVRQVLWGHRAREPPQPQSAPPAAPPPPPPLTHTTGAVHTALLAEVQGEGRAAEAVEGAFRVHTLPILTGHVLALVVIWEAGRRGGTSGAVPTRCAHPPPPSGKGGFL